VAINREMLLRLQLEKENIRSIKFEIRAIFSVREDVD